MGCRKDRDGSHSQTRVLTAANMIAVQGQNVAHTGQTGGVETAVGPGQLETEQTRQRGNITDFEGRNLEMIQLEEDKNQEKKWKKSMRTTRLYYKEQQKNNVYNRRRREGVTETI